MKPFSELFIDTEKSERSTDAHPSDNTGKSKVTDVYFIFNDNSAAVISCYDWSSESEFTDNFRISVRNYDYRKEDEMVEFLEESVNHDHKFSCNNPRPSIKKQPLPFTTSTFNTLTF